MPGTAEAEFWFSFPQEFSFCHFLKLQKFHNWKFTQLLTKLYLAAHKSSNLSFNFLFLVF
jgi:hypothetical protein